MSLKDKVFKKLEKFENEEEFDFKVRHKFRTYYVIGDKIDTDNIRFLIFDDEGDCIIFNE